MSMEGKASLRERRDKLKNFLPFLRELSVRFKNTPFEEKLKKVAVLIETGNLNADKIATLEKTINNLQNLKSRPAPVPVPIKLEIPFAADHPSVNPVCEPVSAVPIVSPPDPPISDVSSAAVKKEPTPDPKYYQSHIETEDEGSENDATNEEALLQEVNKNPDLPKSTAKRGRPPDPKKTKKDEVIVKKRGRPPGSKKTKKDEEIVVKRDEPQVKVRKLDDHVAQPTSIQAVTTQEETKTAKVPEKPSEPTRPAERKTYSPAKPRKNLIGPLKTKISKKLSNEPSKDRPVVTEPATELVDASKESPTIEQSNTNDDNKVNELRNLLKDITGGDAKDPKLLDSFENILGKDGFAKLKALFVGNLSSEERKPAPEPQIVEQQPVESKKQPSPSSEKTKQAVSPLKMPPVSGNHPRGKKRTEVDKLNEDIMNCFIRDGVLKASGLRNMTKVKYEEVVALEDYELDAGSCSDTDTEETPNNQASTNVRESVIRSKQVSVITRPQSSTPSSSHEPTPEPLPATKSCFIEEEKVDLNVDAMEYRLLSGIRGKFELCEELKLTFPGFHKQLQACTSATKVEADDTDCKPVISPTLNDVDLGPMEIITIEDDDIDVPSVKPIGASTTASPFEIITIDDDDTVQATSSCSVLKSALERPVVQFETISIESDEETDDQQEQEDMIYKQVKDFPTSLTASSSKIVVSQEKTVFNLSFVEIRGGILMRCRAEKCFYEHIDQDLFQYHVQTRHCLAKWDGSCSLCKESKKGKEKNFFKAAHKYGSLLDEFDHMESAHISKLKKHFDNPPMPKSASPKLKTAIASSQPLTEKSPQPHQSLLEKNLQKAVNHSAAKSAASNVEKLTSNLCSLASPVPSMLTPVENLLQMLPNNTTLRLRILPGDKLSTGSQSSSVRSDGFFTSPVKNAMQMVAAPASAIVSNAASASSVISSPSVPASPQYPSTFNPVANSTILRQFPVLRNGTPPSTIAKTSAQTYLIPPLRVTLASVSQVPQLQIVPPVSSPNNPLQMLHNQPKKRILRPWLDDDDGKSDNVIKQMLRIDCLRNLYKCMATVCNVHTNDPKEFAQHLASHMTSAIAFHRYTYCAYCLFSAKTIIELVNHIQREHDIDVYGCSQCFYRAVTPETVKDHEKMFHVYTGILIRSNHMETTKINFKEAIVAAKESRRKFVPAIICAGCRLHFYHYEPYRDHLNNVHNSQDTQFRCNRCKELSDCDTVQTHLQSCHNIMSFHCLYCPLGFANINELRKHMVNCHPNKLPFFCERSIKKCNLLAPQSSPESVLLQFMGDLNKHVKVLTVGGVSSVAPK